MSTKSCAGCLVDFNSKECLQCFICHQWYDLLCAGVREKVFKSMGIKQKSIWKCPTCLSKQPKHDNKNTPVRPTKLVSPTAERSPRLLSPTDANAAVCSYSKQLQNQTTPVQTNEDTLVEFSRSTLREIIREEIQSALKDTVSDQFRQINELITGFNESLSFYNEKYEEMKATLEDKSVRIQKLEKDNSGLRDSIQQLSQRLNLVEQNSRSANVELQCVPENKAENLVTTVLQLGKVISCDIKDPDILHCTRIAKKDAQSARPRSILIKFCSPRLRDSFLAASMKFNRTNNQDKLNTSHLGIAAEKPQPIYVSEHLSSENKAIHAAARIRGKELGFKFVWVRDGKVFMKKEDSSQRIVINSLDKLKSLV